MGGTVNIFEGARRIAKIITGLILLTGVLLLLNVEPHFYRQYGLLEGQPILVDTCGSGPSYEARVEGRPRWASVYICGSNYGPDTITLNDAELVALDDAISSARIERYGEIVMGTIIAVAIFAAFTWGTGWVVRGFMSIPRGQDAK